jgi:tetratricopeptide (TPR) repeat protein
MRHGVLAAGLGAAMVICSPAQAQSARDILMDAAYASPDKASAQARIGRALAAAEAALKRDPRDHDAKLQRGLAISYRGKLTRNRGDLLAARRDLESVVAADPRNPEAQLALAGWHLGAVIELGPMMARTVLGARKATGTAALDRSLALGGDRASVAALASLFRIQLDPSDIAGARRLAEAATRASAGTAFDRLMQRQAATLLASLRKGNGKASAATAEKLMPFGRFDT